MNNIRASYRLVGLALLAIILPFALYGAGVAYNRYKDYSTVQTAKEITAYLEDYYATYGVYPPKEEFQQKYSSKYTYSFEPLSPRYYSLYYPVARERDFAMGKPQGDSFLGTTDNYWITSCLTGSRCSGWNGESGFPPADPYTKILSYKESFTLPSDSSFTQRVKEVGLHYMGAQSNTLQFPLSPPSMWGGTYSGLQFDASYFTQETFASRENPALLVSGVVPRDYSYLILRPTGKLGKTTVTYQVNGSTIVFPAEIY